MSVTSTRTASSKRTRVSKQSAPTPSVDGTESSASPNPLPSTTPPPTKPILTEVSTLFGWCMDGNDTQCALSFVYYDKTYTCDCECHHATPDAP